MKIQMAVSGLLLIGFLVGHMAGNLKAFAGKEAFDAYAHGLRTLGYPILPENGFLWVFRLVLLLAIAIHIYSAATLWKRAGSARNTRYHTTKRNATTYAARTMRWGGVILIMFIIFHILQFTVNSIQVNGDHASPYDRVVAGFEVPWVAIFYLFSMVIVCLHVRHGVWSALQTLGLSNENRANTINAIASTVAALLFLGFASVPVAVLAKVLER